MLAVADYSSDGRLNKAMLDKMPADEKLVGNVLDKSKDYAMDCDVVGQN